MIHLLALIIFGLELISIFWLMRLKFDKVILAEAFLGAFDNFFKKLTLVVDWEIFYGFRSI